MQSSALCLEGILAAADKGTMNRVRISYGKNLIYLIFDYAILQSNLFDKSNYAGNGRPQKESVNDTHA